MVSVGIGGYDLLRLDPQNDVPVLSGLAKGGSAVVDLVTGADDGVAADLQEIAGDITDLGGNVLQAMADPVGWLINTGLTFLVDVIQPLDDLLGLVTGNPERMDAEILQWEQVAGQLDPIAEEVLRAASEGLTSWSGEAADAARERLGRFAEGVASLADDVRKLVAVMRIAKVLMEAAQAFVVALIATFVEWLVFTWLAAMVASGPTAGGSTAAAAAATELEAGVALSRGVQFVDRVASVLERIGTVVERIAHRPANPVVRTAPRHGLGEERLDGARNPRTWVTP
jgi:hypothetical protein